MAKKKKDTDKDTKEAVTVEAVAEETIADGKEDEAAVETVAEETATGDEKVEAEAASEAERDDASSIADVSAIADMAEAEGALSLGEQLEQARQEAAQNMEGWQRAAAELANFKRRQEEQHKLQRDRIKAEVLEGVISALDDMELAFQNVPEELDGQLIGWVEGFRLVQRKLDKTLDDQNVMPINTAGEFDPNFHEAVSYEESDEHEEGQIIAEVRKGYQVGNRVLRPALVRVAKNSTINN
jgi:molecular chaperone GrpE